MIKTHAHVYHRHSGLLVSRLLRLAALILLFCLQPYSWAAENKASDQQEKLFIDADYMQLDINTGKSVYRGNVKISHGELVLTGDEVTLEQSKDKVERLTVIGKPVHYNHVTENGENIQAESERMVYIASQHKLIMTVNAKLLQPDHQVSSQIITYDTKNKIVIAGDKSAKSSDGTKTGEKQRVNITLTPKK
jgi:lipopolysaccharide export system protein LptA